MSCEIKVDCDECNLDHEAFAELKECFVMFDKCGEGKIAACLVGRALRALGQNPSNCCIQSLLKKFDKKNDDKIDFDEFRCMMSSYKFKSEREMLDDVAEAFKVFDREEIGSVSMNELKCWLEKSEEPLTECHVNELVKISGGKTTDDSLDYNEFIKRIAFMQQAE